MRKCVGLVALAVVGLMATATFNITLAEGESEAVDVVAKAEAGKYQFIGAAGCKMCHKKEKSGKQYGIWLESNHAKAYETLATEEAKAVAVKAGVEGNPQEADQCLSCHVTAHGAAPELLGKKYKAADGVSCESCHGAGSAYKKKKIMKDHDASIAAGMIVPTEATCTGCHNENSPTFKSFDFEEMFKKIAHPVPETAPEK